MNFESKVLGTLLYNNYRSMFHVRLVIINWTMKFVIKRKNTHKTNNSVKSNTNTSWKLVEACVSFVIASFYGKADVFVPCCNVFNVKSFQALIENLISFEFVTLSSKDVPENISFGNFSFILSGKSEFCSQLQPIILFWN